MKDLRAEQFVVDEPVATRFWGRVYRAHRADGTPVRLSRLARSEPPAGFHLSEELAAASRVDHVGLVAVVGVGDDPTEGLFAVEEWVPGRSVASAMGGPERPAEVSVAELVLAVADALAAAHRAGVVHGCLTEDDVLVGSDGTVRVVGTGIGRAALAADPSAGAAAGSALAPEVRAGERSTGASDVWALGRLLAVLVTRRESEPSGGDGDGGGSAPGQDALVALADEASRRDPGARPPLAEVRRRLAAFGTDPVPRPARVPSPVLPQGGGEPDEPDDLDDPDDPDEQGAGRLPRWATVALGLLGVLAAVGAGLVVTGLLDRDSPSASVRVPDVVGRPERVAEQRLQEVGLDAVFQTQRSDDVERGQVILQEPEAGTSVGEDDQVVLVISTGAGDLLIPEVIGLPRAEAVRTLEAAGFVVEVEEVVVADTPEGQVRTQIPGGENVAERGTTVRLTVAVAASPG